MICDEDYDLVKEYLDDTQSTITLRKIEIKGILTGQINILKQLLNGKYAYYEDLDCYAIDERIKSLSKVLGVKP